MVNGTVKIEPDVAAYISDVRSAMPIERIVLFGSRANGTATNLSDYDLCFFSDSFENQRRVDIRFKLLQIARKYPCVIEPHVFTVTEITRGNPFVDEIMRTGIDV